VLGDKRVAAGCQVADGATTYYALKHGAVETNGLLSSLSGGQILALKIIFAIALLYLLPDAEQATNDDKFLIGTLSLVGCLPAGSNLKLIGELR
jgi:hypothetical protein